MKPKQEALDRIEAIIEGMNDPYKKRGAKKYGRIDAINDFYYFSQLPKEERDQYKAAVIERAKNDPFITFGRVCKLLRIISGISTIEMAEKLETYNPVISNFENDNEPSLNLRQKILDQNIFDLSEEDLAVLKNKNVRTPSPFHREALLAAIEKKISDYNEKKISIDDLPTLQLVVNELLFASIPNHRRPISHLAEKVGVTSNAILKRISPQGIYILRRKDIEQLNAIERWGFTPEQIDLLVQLPNSVDGDISPPATSVVQALSVEMIKKFTRSNNTSTFGELLHKMRNAVDVSLKTLGNATGVTKEAIRLRREGLFIETEKQLSGTLAFIDELVESNPLRFETGDDGKVKPEIVELLKNKAKREYEDNNPGKKADEELAKFNERSQRWQQKQKPPATQVDQISSRRRDDSPGHGGRER